MNRAILLISCPDQKGITASVTNFIFQNNGNILHADQHIDDLANVFFMRVEWDLKNFYIDKSQIQKQFEPIAQKFNMAWELSFTDQVSRVAIFVSKHLHCLYDLLIRHKSGQLHCQIPIIISNHPDAKIVAKDFGINFMEIPITAENKKAQEKRELDLLKEANINLIVLARYHQILSAEFVDQYAHRIINIHHSFLPAFVGQNPYLQAHQKGVKIIGATSHYVIEELDQGPIIEQDTVRISHRNSVNDLLQKGQDLERMVLSQAVRWHLERKILFYGNKTVVFD